MNSVKTIIFTILILFFLFFSFSPTVFELYKAHPPTGKLADPNREFILEHNYYWPDFNLYLSKIRQGWEGRLTALERYTSEKHTGSFIQEFYVILGLTGRTLGLDPNFSYQLGRLILSPLLLLVIFLLIRSYFPTNPARSDLVSGHKINPFFWQILAFLIVITSTSFPRFYSGTGGAIHVGRYMEWWSNIDALQRITFIPHILFGQVVSFYLLYKLTMKQFNNVTIKELFIYILLGNLVGLTFPPSLITLNSVIFLNLLLRLFAGDAREKQPINRGEGKTFEEVAPKGERVSNQLWADSTLFHERVAASKKLLSNLSDYRYNFLIFSLPSLLYILIITRQLPWSALVEFHRSHPMLIPFREYILGTGPIFFLGLAGAIVAIVKRDRKFVPLILWILVTFFFAVLFTVIKEQSPLRFTQTGLFIPLGILGAYFFYQVFHLSDLSHLGHLSRKTIRVGLTLLISLYIFENLFMMKVSYDWQTTFISQRIGANIPPVPYPPQTMYPLKAWMDGIRYLRDHTNRDDVVIAEITAGNFIPAYSGNTVYFGQSNTVDYNRKQLEMENFYKGQMKASDAQNFLSKNSIKYIFFSIQEKERAQNKDLTFFYPFLKSVYSNSLVNIYQAD